MTPFKWLWNLLWPHLEKQIFISMPEQNIDTTDNLYPDWDTQHKAKHNARALCDLAGLTLNEKNLISACIYQESRFLVNPKPNENKSSDGTVWSRDFGIVQINDHYNIGPGKPFASVEEVITNPQKCVQFMIDMYKAGRLSMWSSYTSGAYRQWLAVDSPMWTL